MDDGGDAAEGVRGDPHEFGEVEVGRTELVELPDELIGVGAAEAEGFAGALLADGLLGAASGKVSWGMPILAKTAWIQAVFRRGFVETKGFLSIRPLGSKRFSRLAAPERGGWISPQLL